MDINLFNNLQLNGAELKSVQKELTFEFSVQDFLVRAVEDNGVAKAVYVMHQGQTYTDPAYLANWQTWTDHVFNAIKPVIEAGDKPVVPVSPVASVVVPVKPLINFDDDDQSNNKSTKKSQPEPKSKLPLIIIIIIAVLAIIVAGVWWVVRDHEELIPTPAYYNGLDFEPSPSIEEDPLAGEISEYNNALAFVQRLIEFNPQSQANIIEELMISGFSDEVIEWTLKQIEFEVNWYDQAVRMAQSFMESWTFTPEELYENIVASGFSKSQAEHAISMIEFE